MAGDDPVEIVRRAIDAWSRRDHEAVLALFADDATLEFDGFRVPMNESRGRYNEALERA